MLSDRQTEPVTSVKKCFFAEIRAIPTVAVKTGEAARTKRKPTSVSAKSTLRAVVVLGRRSRAKRMQFFHANTLIKQIAATHCVCPLGHEWSFHPHGFGPW